MMIIRETVLLTVCALFLLSPVIATAGTVDGMAISSMKDRVPTLVKAKDAGQIGEQRDGLVGLVSDSAPADIKALVADENANRKTVYEARAAEQSKDLEVFMRVMGDSRIDNEKAGRFVQKFDGSWAKKN
ncbi:MAG: YdbL family protein [Bdellovibrionota bacterium]